MRTALFDLQASGRQAEETRASNSAVGFSGAYGKTTLLNRRNVSKIARHGSLPLWWTNMGISHTEPTPLRRAPVLALLRNPKMFRCS